MIYTTLTKKALQICFEAHKDQLDKAGAPYVLTDADRARVAKYAQALELLKATE